MNRREDGRLQRSQQPQDIPRVMEIAKKTGWKFCRRHRREKFSEPA
jgi:hypothetical protein